MRDDASMQRQPLTRIHRPRTRRNARQRQGTVLLLVMIVVIILSFAGFSFTAFTFTEHKSATLNGEMLQVEQAAESAETLLLRILELPPEQQAELGGLEDAPELFRNISLVRRADGQDADGPRFTVIAPRIEANRPNGIRYGLTDTSGKLHLGRLLEWELRTPGAGQQALLRLPGMTEALADAMLDWLDADDEPRPFGAEHDYYAGLDEPYQPRNGVPASLEELLLVRGMTRILLFGADHNLNYVIDPLEAQQLVGGALASTGEQSLPLAHFVTVVSAEGMLRPDGSPRIWLNNPNLAQLHDELLRAFDERLANFVIGYRQFGGTAATTSSDPAGGEPSTNSSPAVDLTRPANTSFVSVFDVLDAVVQGTDEGGRSVVWPSPYSSELVRSGEELATWLRTVAVAPPGRLAGRINVNTASREVLLSVPGLSEATVERIVAARESQSASMPVTPRNAVWLWTEGLVTLDEMKVLDAELTGQGDVWETQIVGFWPAGGPAARAYAVLDGTVRPARRLYWKDLRLHGTGFSQDALTGELPEP